MIDRLNGRTSVAIAVVGLLLVVVVGWLGFVSPQRSKAADLAAKISDSEHPACRYAGARRRSPAATEHRRACRHSGRPSRIGQDVAAPASALRRRRPARRYASSALRRSR